ncbi:MAG: DUF2087 domain-containing protein [Clostridia bacterium]|nr:DUF2087 domain-containing protein [Clostridia bacterium]
MEYVEIIKNFLDSEQRLKDYPAKRKMQVACLFYLATKFEPDRKYKEIEINMILKKWNTFGDHATLRRDMIDAKIMQRTDDCREYWLANPQPTPADLGFEF